MYSIEFANAARRDIADLAEWYAARSPATAARLATSLQSIAALDLGMNPECYAYFWITGRPYRGRIYQLSRHTKFWIVYRVYKAERRIDVLRIWNASRNPAAFEL
jgi:plasmid stabilization system protein ParE